jgi:hypothetical protein
LSITIRSKPGIPPPFSILLILDFPKAEFFSFIIRAITMKMKFEKGRGYGRFGIKRLQMAV